MEVREIESTTIGEIVMDKIKDDPEEIRLTGKAEKNLHGSKKKPARVKTKKTA